MRSFSWLFLFCTDFCFMVLVALYPIQLKVSISITRAFPHGSFLFLCLIFVCMALMAVLSPEKSAFIHDSSFLSWICSVSFFNFCLHCIDGCIISNIPRKVSKSITVFVSNRILFLHWFFACAVLMSLSYLGKSITCVLFRDYFCSALIFVSWYWWHCILFSWKWVYR